MKFPLWMKLPLLLLALHLFSSVAESSSRVVQTGVIDAPEAVQAAAADDRFAYAIASTVVAQYDRTTGQRVALSTGPAKHLNSAFLSEGKLYCAHSNYPRKPEQSEIRVLDPATMELSIFKDFGQSNGSLTWAVRENGTWWCTFAYYKEENARTRLVKFDQDWKQVAEWTYPPEVIKDLGEYSISGGVWRDRHLFVTGHDRRVLYRLRLPQHGSVLELVQLLPSPFTGQGIANDVNPHALIGIDRGKKQIIFGELRN